MISNYLWVLIIGVVIIFGLIVMESRRNLKTFREELSTFDKEKELLTKSTNENRRELKFVLSDVRGILRDYIDLSEVWVNEMLRIFDEMGVDVKKNKLKVLSRFIPIQERLRLVEVRMCGKDEIKGHLWWLAENGSEQSIPYLEKVKTLYEDDKDICDLFGEAIKSIQARIDKQEG